MLGQGCRMRAGGGRRRGGVRMERALTEVNRLAIQHPAQQDDCFLEIYVHENPLGGFTESLQRLSKQVSCTSWHCSNTSICFLCPEPHPAQRIPPLSQSKREEVVRADEERDREMKMEMSGCKRQKLIGHGHPVMCGACSATIPPSSRLSMYRLLAGVYYAEGRLSHGNPDSSHKLQKHHRNQVRRVSGHEYPYAAHSRQGSLIHTVSVWVSTLSRMDSLGALKDGYIRGPAGLTPSSATLTFCLSPLKRPSHPLRWLIGHCHREKS
ncbi:hypothetical protein Q8A73_012053 [Channa argus]|nr:hypothetical protein Q8A73_012053 [Channa argus]